MPEPKPPKPPPLPEFSPEPSAAPGFCVGCGCTLAMELRKVLVRPEAPERSKTTSDLKAEGPLAWQCRACGNVYMDEHVPPFVNYTGERF
jgi:hypothetical protein